MTPTPHDPIPPLDILGIAYTCSATHTDTHKNTNKKKNFQNKRKDGRVEGKEREARNADPGRQAEDLSFIPRIHMRERTHS